MIEILTHKLGANTTYTPSEMKWLINHIGDHNPDVRDSLVYSTFYHSLIDGVLTLEQYVMLSKEVLEKNLLRDPKPVTRSFSALLGALLLTTDNDANSPYYQLLPAQIRLQFLTASIEMLATESDATGKDHQLGWVHTIAHLADFMGAACCHDDFPSDHISKAWSATMDCLHRQRQTFSAGESDRLASVFSALILSQKLSQDTLTSWLEQEDFPDKSDDHFFAKLNFQAFIAKLYFDLKAETTITSKLEKTLLAHRD